MLFPKESKYFGLIASLVFSTGCSQATSVLSSMGLTSTYFSLSQGDSETLHIAVNKISNDAYFQVNCPAAAKELQISNDEGTTWTKLSDINCGNLKDSVHYVLPATSSVGPSPQAPLVKIPFQIRATGPEFQTKAISGNFVKPDFSSSSFLIENGASITNKSTVELTLTTTLMASDIELIPTEAYITNVAGCGGGSSWVPFAKKISGIPLPAPNNPNFIYVKFRDAAQNESTCVTNAINHDGIAPVAHSVVINSGDAQATSLDVTVSHIATGDVAEMKIFMNADCSGTANWVAYSTTSNRRLAGPGLNYISAQFRDAVGNESLCVADSITYDTDPPVTPTSITRGPGILAVDNENPITLLVSPYIEGDTIRIYSDSSCSTLLANATSTAQGTSGSISVTLPGEGSYQFWTRVNDYQGSYSACSTASVGYQLDSQGPANPSVTSPLVNGDYLSGASIPIRLNFAEAVLVSGTPFINVALYGATIGVQYSSGSNTNSLEFNYVVQAEHASQDLDLAAVNPLDLSSGQISDLSGNPFTGTVPTGTMMNSLATNKNITVQFLASISEIVKPLAGTFLPRTIEFLVRWTAPVVITGSPRLNVGVGSGTIQASYQTAKSSSKESVFQVASWTADDYDGIQFLSFALNGGTVRNQFGTNATVSFASFNMPDVKLISGSDPQPSFASSNYAEFSESAGAVSIPITVVNAPEIDLEVKFIVMANDRGATSGDHTLQSGSVTIPAGQTTANISFQITEDFETEGTEGFTIALVGTGYGTLSLTNLTKEVFITDNDSLPAFSTITKVSQNYQGAACFITSSGSLYCWGTNTYGQVGNGTQLNQNVPVQIFSSGATDVSAGQLHTCAAVSGAAYCWGNNQSGQLGNNTNTTRLTPTLVSGISNVQEVRTANSVSCALHGTGNVSCWGAGNTYRIGNGLTSNQLVPYTLPLSNVSKISLTDSHACAISSGQLYCWGLNSNGQLGLGNTTTAMTPTLANNPTGLPLLDIQTSIYKTCGLFNNSGNGTVLCWGHQNYLGRTSGTAVISIPPVAQATQTNVVNFQDGGRSDYNTVVQLNTGYNTYWNSTSVANTTIPSSGIGSFSGGWWFSPSASGTSLYSNNSIYRVSQGTTISNNISYPGISLSKISNYASKCYLTISGEIYCSNLMSYTGDGASTSRGTPVRIGSGFKDVASTYAGGCGLRTDNTLWCWGSNSSQAVGDNTTSTRSTPVFVGSNFTSIRGGNEHYCGLKTNQDLMCWGYQTHGQVGTGTIGASESVRKPTLILSKVTSYDAGANHNCAISDSNLYCWGQNSNGQLGDLSGAAQSIPTSVYFVEQPNSIQQVSLGDSHSCMIKNGGDVVCWGLNSSGQLGRGNTANVPFPFDTVLTNATSISANSYSTCAMDQASNLKCWGGFFGVSPPATPSFTGVTNYNPGQTFQVQTPTGQQVFGSRTSFWAPQSSADTPLFGFPTGQ